MKNESLEEILASKIGTPNLIEILSYTPPYKLIPILIESYRKRAEQITPQELLKTYDSKKDFYGISEFSQREIIHFQKLFYDVLPRSFDDVEFSPISPLGTNSVMTSLSQNKLLSTIRNSEVVGDPTTYLALEAASRRKELSKRKETFYNKVKLGTFHRVLRMQPFDKTKGYMQHFNLLGIITAERTSHYTKYISSVLVEHLEIWMNFINHLKHNDYIFNDISICISNNKIIEAIIKKDNLAREDIIKNTGSEEYDFFESFNIEFPKTVESISEVRNDLIEKYELGSVFNQMLQIEKFLNEHFSIKYPNVNITFDFNRIRGLGYYKDYCIHIFATNSTGRREQLSDGGSVNYLQLLLSDKKEVAFTSGFGAELIQKIFKKTIS